MLLQSEKAEKDRSTQTEGIELNSTVRGIGVKPRGYKRAEITFPDLRILVGENNEGKSSLLKMIHRLISEIDEDFWRGDRRLARPDLAFWMPANETAGRARRLTLKVRVEDGRVGRRFSASKGDILDLRFGIKKTDETARLNLGPPKKAESHDDLASLLLSQLKSALTFLLIPPIRDAARARYSDHLLEEVRVRLKEALTHKRRGGASTEYRKAKRALKDLSSVVDTHSKHFNLEGESVLARMIRETTVKLGADADDLAAWLLMNLQVVLSTGDHDSLMVSPEEVGNGLQSLIDLSLAIARSRQEPTGKDLIIVVEEPESFLHPSAQRDLVMSIRDQSAQNGCRMVLTTHSPIIIDESRFSEVALVRDQRIYEPRQLPEHREEINTSFLAGTHAEIFFADAVLFVEGPSDFAYFNSLLRRLRIANPDVRALSRIVFHPVGGKSAFAPWRRLLDAYRDAGQQPIRFLCLVDADAFEEDQGSPSAAATCLDLCGVQLSSETKQQMRDFAELPYDDTRRRSDRCSELNAIIHDVLFHAFPIDLEWEIVRSLSGANLAKTASLIGASSKSDKQIVARKLGSKVGTGKSSGAKTKRAYFSAGLAKKSHREEISPFVRSCFDELLRLAGSSKRWKQLRLDPK